MQCCFSESRSSRHSGQGGFPDQDRLAVQLLHLKDSQASVDRLTQRTETSCDEISRESTPLGRSTGNITMETAQVERCSRSPDIHPRNSTPKQDVHAQQNGFHHSGQHSGTTQTTPLHSIPERAKDHSLLHGRPDMRSKSSPMLRGTRFSSEVSNTSKIQQY